jgi:hypothetical protein
MACYAHILQYGTRYLWHPWVPQISGQIERPQQPCQGLHTHVRISTLHLINNTNAQST